MSDSKLSPMQEEIFRRIDGIFSAIASTVERAGQFAAEQLPDIALQYVAFGRAHSTLTIALSVLIPVLCWFFTTRFIKTHEDPFNTEPGFVYVAVSLIATGVSMMAFFINIKEFLLVWFAPKVWLIMEIAELARKVKG